MNQSQPVVNDAKPIHGVAARYFLRMLPWLMLFFGFYITYDLWQSARREAERLARVDFDIQLRDISERVSRRMDAYEQVLRGVDSLFVASSHVESQEFHDYIANLHLSRYPGIQGIGYLQLVPEAEKGRVIESLRKEGYSEFNGLPAGPLPTLAVTLYVEPFVNRNLRALGHNPYANPVRREAMERGRDRGQAAITTKIILVQDVVGPRQAGVGMYLPVFARGVPHDTPEQRRGAIRGWVVGILLMNDLMTGIVGESDGVDVELFDGQNIAEHSMLYGQFGRIGQRKLSMQASTRLDIAGHTWSLRISSRPGYEQRFASDKPRIVVVAGCVSSLLAMAILWLFLHGREIAERRAQALMRALHLRENHYRQMFESNNTIKYLIDPETGVFVEVNEAAAAYWGYTSEQLCKLTIFDISIEVRETLHPRLLKIADERQSVRSVILHRRKDGDIVELEVFIDVVDKAGRTLLFAIALDRS